MSIPLNHDVLCGRGSKCNTHPGNIVFRRMIALNREIYKSSTQHNREAVAKVIVESVKNATPPGRFLSRAEDGSWCEIDDKKALHKTRQAFRDDLLKPSKMTNISQETKNKGVSYTSDKDRPRGKWHDNGSNTKISSCLITPVVHALSQEPRNHFESNGACTANEVFSMEVDEWEALEINSTAQNQGNECKRKITIPSTQNKSSHTCAIEKLDFAELEQIFVTSHSSKIAVDKDTPYTAIHSLSCTNVHEVMTKSTANTKRKRSHSVDGLCQNESNKNQKPNRENTNSIPLTLSFNQDVGSLDSLEESSSFSGPLQKEVSQQPCVLEPRFAAKSDGRPISASPLNQLINNDLGDWLSNVNWDQSAEAGNDSAHQIDIEPLPLQPKEAKQKSIE